MCVNRISWVFGNGKLRRAKTSDFNLRAKKSKYTKLCSEKIEKILDKKIPT